MEKQPHDAVADVSQQQGSDRILHVVSRSPAEAATASPITISYGRGIEVIWTPTGRVEESKDCTVCHRPIVGEDARLYTRTETIRRSIVDETKHEASVVTRTYTMRAHFLHHRDAPVSQRLVEPNAYDSPLLRSARALSRKWALAQTPQTVEDFEVARTEAEELAVHVMQLERDLAISRSAYDQVVRKLRSAPEAVKVREPYKSDVKATCRKCSTKTLWRSGRGAAECYPECPEEKAIVTESRRASRQASLDAAARILFDEVDD